MILFNVCIALFMAGLSHRAVVVSLPTLREAFHTSLTTIQWTLLIYDLALIGLVLTLGRLGDLLGRKGIYVGGFLLFVLGSALCGLSGSALQLIAFRAVQGIGGSMLTASARALVSVATPPERRGRAFGVTSMAFHVGFLTGPTLGGFLIDTVGWRWIFYINVPVGLLGAYLASKIIMEMRDQPGRVRVDFAGAFLLLATNVSLLYAMNQLPHTGANDPAFYSFLLVSATALALFVWTELRVDSPILSLSLFRIRLFSFAHLSLFFITSTQSAIQILIPFYLQNIMGFTPSQMGWIIIANSVVIVMVAPIAGWMSDRLGSRLLCSTGSALIVVAQFFLASLTLEASIPRIILPLALSGLGWAVFNSPNQSAIFGSVPTNRAGAASGMSITTARIGGALGIALSVSLFTYGLTAGGLTHAQIESQQSWTSSPELFMRTFNRTVHVINFFTLLAVVFSALRGKRPD